MQHVALQMTAADPMREGRQASEETNREGMIATSKCDETSSCRQSHLPRSQPMAGREQRTLAEVTLEPPR